jgi:hypothetical protein
VKGLEYLPFHTEVVQNREQEIARRRGIGLDSLDRYKYTRSLPCHKQIDQIGGPDLIYLSISRSDQDL